MGKKRIALVGEPKKTKAGLSDETSHKLVKFGKQHGRITDVSQKVLAEAATIEQKAKKLEQEIEAKTKDTEKPKKAKPAKKRSKRYQEVRTLVDRTKAYPLSEAIKLLKKTSISRFKGSVETHFVTRQTGLKSKVKFPHPTGKTSKIAIVGAETKAPLIHQIIGRVDDSQKNLEENFQALIKVIGSKNIKKAVITSTMGPGIKVTLKEA